MWIINTKSAREGVLVPQLDEPQVVRHGCLASFQHRYLHVPVWVHVHVHTHLLVHTCAHAHADTPRVKLGESVPVTQLALAVVGMLSTHKSGLSHGRGPAFQGERSDVAPGLLSWQEQPKGWQEEKALC